MASSASQDGAPAAGSLSLARYAEADPLIDAVVDAVRAHMGRYDSSHDFAHILRVVGLALHIADATTRDTASPIDKQLVLLAALLHDVGDHKYLDASAQKYDPLFPKPGEAAVAAVLRKCGAELDLARRVVHVCANVSWSAEMRTPTNAAAVADLARACPELAIVQDADRLDALGAVGAARCFAFGGAQSASASATQSNKKSRTLNDSIAHFDEKLLLVGSRMKTAEGRRLAMERTERLRQMQAWFREEASFAVAES